MLPSIVYLILLETLHGSLPPPLLYKNRAAQVDCLTKLKHVINYGKGEPRKQVLEEQLGIHDLTPKS